MNGLLCIDDTDQKGGPGTGHLLQALCEQIEEKGWGKCSAISRHQLFVDDAIPYTSHNSALCCEVSLMAPSNCGVIDFCGSYLEEFSAPGSDPGLCLVALPPAFPACRLIDFGRRAKRTVVTKTEAYRLADFLGIHLSEHGGTGQGVVGALAGAGLRLSGNDGRFRGWYHLGREGEMRCVAELVAHPFFERVESESGGRLSSETVVRFAKDELKLVLRGGRQTLLVTKEDGGWRTLTREEVKKY
jgi:hypothetical protein